MVDEARLRQRVRDRLTEHRLPHGRAITVRETPSNGRLCDACEELISVRDRAVVALVAREMSPGWMLHFHINCYVAWELERLTLAGVYRTNTGG
jgi:hypothetical protein